MAIQKKPACLDERAAGDFIDDLVPRADHDVGKMHKAALLSIALQSTRLTPSPAALA
jgi:hypothetical protein